MLLEEYHKALRQGLREVRSAAAAGRETGLLILPESMEAKAVRRESLGVVEIPMELIDGTCNAMRRDDFSPGFLPVLDEESEEFIELVNPEIVSRSGEQTGLEGCLSVPGKWGIVTRPDVVRVRAQDRDGNWFEVEGEGLTARAFCHEIEHLDGHLFLEHVDHILSDEELREYLDNEEREAQAAAEAAEHQEEA